MSALTELVLHKNISNLLTDALHGKLFKAVRRSKRYALYLN
jgi:hypothetical protein